MLKSIYIKDFILIEKLDLDLHEGFCVITGETGAGKSIILDAILFCLGQKTSSNPIRPSAENTSVTLTFSCNNKFLKEIDIDIDEIEDIVIKCVQNIQGKKRFFLNDQVVTSKVINILFNHLLELHGQHNHTILLNSTSHLDILDSFGNFYKIRNEVSLSYRNWQNLQQQVTTFENHKEKIKQEIDYLTHICQEIKDANIEEGEEENLTDARRKIQFFSKEKALIASILKDIDEGSIEKTILRIQKTIANYGNSKTDTPLEQASMDLDIAYQKIEDARASLANMLSNMTFPEQSLDEIEERLYQIRTLARKHSCRPDELSTILEKHLNKLVFLQQQVTDSFSLEEKLVHSRVDYFTLAHQLSQKRHEAAVHLEKKVTAELSYLDMKKAIFKLEIESNDNFASIKGIDRVQFSASTNPGMAISAIDKVASGGELSRLMLALRVALFDSSPKQTIIFDEIDVGISGAVADAIGQRLKELSKVVQILVITHQPQVAGKANQHILVSKQQHENHTIAEVQTLNNELRIYEIARMISGKEITDAGIKAAKELL